VGVRRGGVERGRWGVLREVWRREVWVRR